MRFVPEIPIESGHIIADNRQIQILKNIFLLIKNPIISDEVCARDPD